MDSERPEEKKAPRRVTSLAGLALVCFGACAGVLVREMGLGREFFPHWFVPLVLGSLLFVSAEVGIGLGDFLRPLRRLRRGRERAPAMSLPAVAAPALPKRPLNLRASVVDLAKRKGGVAFMAIGLALLLGGPAGALVALAHPEIGEIAAPLLIFSGLVGPLLGGPLFRLGQNWEHARWFLEKTEQNHALEAQAQFERFSMSGIPSSEDEREALRRKRERGSAIGGGAA
ncbi:hypothetical protein HY251_05940 [bacterium]|nr:hypothetical protein [bacterium]